MQTVKILNHAVASLQNATGTVLSQNDSTAEVLFQLGTAPDSQVIAHIALSDLKRTNEKAVVRWKPPDAVPEPATLAPIVVSEARDWSEKTVVEKSAAKSEDFSILRMINETERDTALNLKLRIRERGVSTVNARRERNAERERLQRAEMECLSARGDLSATEKRILSRYRNRFDAAPRQI